MSTAGEVPVRGPRPAPPVPARGAAPVTAGCGRVNVRVWGRPQRPWGWREGAPGDWSGDRARPEDTRPGTEPLETWPGGQTHPWSVGGNGLGQFVLEAHQYVTGSGVGLILDPTLVTSHHPPAAGGCFHRYPSGLTEMNTSVASQTAAKHLAKEPKLQELKAAGLLRGPALTHPLKTIFNRQNGFQVLLAIHLFLS